MNTLKQLQEKGEKEFYKNFYEDGLFAPGKYNGEVVLNWCNQQTTLAYNAGKADILDTVLKEIEDIKQSYYIVGGWPEGHIGHDNPAFDIGRGHGRNEILDTLKNKLLDNK